MEERNVSLTRVIDFFYKKKTEKNRVGGQYQLTLQTMYQLARTFVAGEKYHTAGAKILGLKSLLTSMSYCVAKSSKSTCFKRQKCPLAKCNISQEQA